MSGIIIALMVPFAFIGICTVIAAVRIELDIRRRGTQQRQRR